ncbi:unnamed protein product [Cyclocybe aegerita]|uniref:tRNA-dihydrouridine(47) synthase [NAD(P)(+)] n=1 Tax=Cyclocybe aegerita TaxID=1973307 RepID=A0A8S0WBW0_CYCAE|nr:unnamed protein product [Cyclocybe aegerita]
MSSMTANSYPAGTAPIKSEFLVSGPGYIDTPDDDAAEGGSGSSRQLYRESRNDRDGQAGGKRGKITKEQKKTQRGQNKGRRFGKTRDELDLCWKIANGAVCEYGDQCRFIHDIPGYISAKAADIHIPFTNQISDIAPFTPSQEDLQKLHPVYTSIDTSTSCPVFAEAGECRYGFKCRFLGGHVRFEQGEDGQASLSLVGGDDKKARAALSSNEVNFVGAEVQKQLRSRKYPVPISDTYLRELAAQSSNEVNGKPKAIPDKNSVIITEPEQQLEDIEMDTPTVLADGHAPPPTTLTTCIDTPAGLAPVDSDFIEQKRTGDSSTSQTDTPDVPVRFAEKKKLHWTGKTYLAPLTTVGNLPFRRLCVALGAEITCGEMGLASSFLSGSKEEWSLVRRHPSERIFGVQVAGNKPANLVPTAEVLTKECGGGIDFVDVNCGCPIDLVFKSGSGSALLDSVGKLGKILIGMNRALGEIPLTVKLRNGVKDGKNTAHKLMPRLGSEWGVGAATVHGRTRQQRYTRLADWDYIKQCVEAVRAREKDEDLPPIPIFGGGDCFSSAGYWACVDSSGVDGVMIGRGALIKPWIFTEIKERREWDISATERMELVRKYAEYGLNHFGSDTTGVNTTRRYLCEALSFQYRYVPIGLLEVLPGRINDRAPSFRGRSELETLLASPASSDWVKISEMFLGPAPETWSFTPKHKSNAYGSEEGQG